MESINTLFPVPQPMTPQQAYAFLNQYMKFIIPDATSRILGQQSINANVLDVYAYWQQAVSSTEWGNPTISVILDRPRVLVFLVSNISIGGQGAYSSNLYFWGIKIGGKNTVVTKQGFWRLGILEPRTLINNVFLQSMP